MNYDNILSVLCRVFTFGSLALIALAVLESVANAFSLTLIHEAYRPGRLVEFATMAAVLASALFLRQIRQELRRKTSA